MTTRSQMLNTLLLKVLLVLLSAIFISLQYRLWFASGNVGNTGQLEEKVARQKLMNEKQVHINDQLRAEIHALKNNPKEIEARAREELGLVKPEETFFMLVE